VPVGFSARGPLSLIPAGYQGPGDVLGNWIFWYGTRPFSNATVTNTLFRIRRPTDTVEMDVAADGDGVFDRVGIQAWEDAAGSTTAGIIALYDQAGAGNPFAPAIPSIAPLLSWTGDRPEAFFSSGSTHRLTRTGNSTVAQPISVHTMGYHFTGATRQQLVDFGLSLYYRVSANNQISFNAGTEQSFTASDDAWHTYVAVANGASGGLSIDGAALSTVNAGTGGLSTGDYGVGQVEGVGFFLDGAIREWGVRSVASSDADCTAYYNNLAAYWA